MGILNNHMIIYGGIDSCKKPLNDIVSFNLT